MIRVLLMSVVAVLVLLSLAPPLCTFLPSVFGFR